MFIIELKWLLLLLLLLPLLSVAITLGIVYWIDQRRRAQSTLQAIRPLLENAPFGVVASLPGRNTPYLNAYTRRTLGAGLEQLAPESRALLARRAASDGRTQAAPGHYLGVESDVKFLSDGAKRRMRWWFSSWAGTELTFFVDKSKQQQIEQRFNLLLGRLSHELRTPLETIAIHLEVAQLPATSDEQKKQSLAYAKKETQRMIHLSNSALELVRLENSSYTETQLVELTTLVEEVARARRSRAEEKEIELRVQADAPLPPVVGNAEELKQVFTNLLNNSLAHGRRGDRVLVSLKQDEAGVLCTVRDSGPGIDAKHLPHLTEPFYRVLSSSGQSAIDGQSTGLGLAIVSEILQQHQSRLRIESTSESEATPEKPAGTTMRFVLPVRST